MDFCSISWDELHQLVFQIAEKMTADNYHPDLIIAIARGGLSVSQIFSDYFDNCPIITFTISSYKNLQQNQISSVKFKLDEKINLKNKKLLLVDDLSDTGDTFLSGLKYLKSLNANNIKTAAVFVKSHTKFHPDYHAIDNDSWIIFPYEMKETTKNLIDKFKKEKMSEIQIREKLKQLKIGKIYSEKYFSRE